MFNVKQLSCKKQPPQPLRRMAQRISLTLIVLLTGCGTMIFHNGSPLTPQPTNDTILTALTIPTSQPPTAFQAQTTLHRPVSATEEIIFVYQHEVKTSENIIHYMSGQSTTAISLSDWCSPQQWQAVKTEQSAFDMIVRWIASPLYAINSLSLSCTDASPSDTAQGSLINHTNDLAEHTQREVTHRN